MSQAPSAPTATTPSVSTAMDGAVAVVSLQSRPYNLLNVQLCLDIIEGLNWSRRQEARAVILRSSLRHFSAGADLDAMVEAANNSDVLDWHLLDVLRAFDEHPAPIVASVQGVCVGGGFELALACDLIVAAQSAKIGSVEATVGLHPLMGGIQRLAQRAGATRAKEMAMLGAVTTQRRWSAGTSSTASCQMKNSKPRPWCSPRNSRTDPRWPTRPPSV